jgi:hypothetical protein
MNTNNEEKTKTYITLSFFFNRKKEIKFCIIFHLRLIEREKKVKLRESRKRKLRCRFFPVIL